MRRIMVILVMAMMLISCERVYHVEPSVPVDDNIPDTMNDNLPDTINDNIPDTIDNPPIIEEQSPIKGEWKCLLEGLHLTLEYGDNDVKYTCYTEYYDATAIYKGTYTIKDSLIRHEFTSLTTKNSSKLRYAAPEELPKEAVLEDENTIIYTDRIYKRE